MARAVCSSDNSVPFLACFVFSAFIGYVKVGERPGLEASSGAGPSVILVIDISFLLTSKLEPCHELAFLIYFLIKMSYT